MSNRSQRHQREIAGRDSADQAWEPGKGGGYGGGNLRVAPSVPGFNTFGPPTSFTATYVSDTACDLAWVAPVGVGDGSTIFGYALYRDGVEIMVANTAAFSDTGPLVAGETYVYTIVSFDDSSRISGPETVIYVSAP